jgi:hypothetical protein
MYECIQLAIHGEIVFPDWIHNLIHFNHFALVINSSINILIYCWRDKKFLHIMLVTCRIKPKDSLPLTGVTRASSGRRIRIREEENLQTGNGDAGSRVRHVQIELKPVDVAMTTALKPEVDKNGEEIKISMVTFATHPQEHVISRWAEPPTQPQEAASKSEDEEESCKCCCGYNSESPSCCSNPEEVIAKSGKMSAATQVPTKD